MDSISNVAACVVRLQRAFRRRLTVERRSVLKLYGFRGCRVVDGIKVNRVPLLAYGRRNRHRHHFGSGAGKAPPAPPPAPAPAPSAAPVKDLSAMMVDATATP